MSPLFPTIYLLFLELSWGSITTLDFIVNNGIRQNGFGLRTSDKDSDVMSLVWTIASTSAKNIWSDSSFRLIPCTFSTASKIERANLIWRLHTPPILPAVGGLLFQWIHWPPCSSINALILCGLSLKMPCAVLHWPQRNLYQYQFWWLEHYPFLIQIFEVLVWRHQ